MKDIQGTELPKDSEKPGYKALLDSLRDQLSGDREWEEAQALENEPEVLSPLPTHVPFPEGKKYFRIGEVADLIGVEAYVLRYWESEFGSIRPKKSRSGQRIYDRRDVLQLSQVHYLLHVEKFSLQGAKRKLIEMRRAQKTAALAPRKVEPEVLRALAQDVRELIDLLQKG